MSKLRGIYGDRLANIFEGTPLEEEGRKLGFGGYLVRGVIGEESADQFHASLDRDMQHQGNEKGRQGHSAEGQQVVVQHDPVRNGQLHMQMQLRGHCQALTVPGE